MIPWSSFCIVPPSLVIADSACNIKSLGLQKGQSILEIWNDENFVNCRKQIVENNINKVCRKECVNGIYSYHYRFNKELQIR
jgi:hypothetical protein